MATTARLERVVETLRNANLIENIKPADLAELLDVSNKTAGKYLSELVKEGLAERTGRGIYKLTGGAVSEEAEDSATETESVENVSEEVENNETEAPAENDGACETREYDVYVNGNYVTSLETTLEEITDQVRVSYPGALLEQVRGNKVYFVEQSGTKG